MKKFLAVALVGLMTTSASAMNLYLVARTGPKAYNGVGVPTSANGGVGNNASGAGGSLPSAGGNGIYVATSGTAKMGLVIQLMNGTYNDGGTVTPAPNQLSTANVFFNQQALGDLGSVDLANVTPTSINDNGNPWGTTNYSTGMSHWIGLGSVLTGNGPAPLIEDFHQISFDDLPSPGGEGGNSFAIRPLWLHTEITVHGIPGHAGDEARITYDFGNTEFFNEQSKKYLNETVVNPNAAGGNHGRDPNGPDGGGVAWPVNGRTSANAFPIEVTVPEPATLSLLVIGAAAMLRRRVK